MLNLVGKAFPGAADGGSGYIDQHSGGLESSLQVAGDAELVLSQDKQLDCSMGIL
jgi:hypothetical protein